MVKAEAPRASTVSSRPSLGRRPLLPSGTVLYLLPAFAVYGLFVLWPLLRVLWLSLQRWDGYGPQVFIGITNFVDLGNDDVFRTALAHSIEWELAAASFTTLVALSLALLLRRSRWQRLLLVTAFFPVMLPATVVAAICVLVYSPSSGLLNTLLRAAHLDGLAGGWLGDPRLALPALFAAWMWASLGVGTLIFRAALGRIGREYVELALIEGAGPGWRLRHVLLPGIRYAGVLALLINVALAAQVFDLVFVTTGGGPGYATMLLPLDMYGRAFGGHTGQGAAVACAQIAISLVPAVVALVAWRPRQEEMDGMENWEARTRPSVAGTGAATVAGIALILPLAWLLAIALGAVQLQPGVPVAGLDPRSWQWENFRVAWDAGMAGAYATSGLFSLLAVGLTVSLAAPAAFAIARLVHRRILRWAVLLLLVAGLFQPTPVMVIPLFWLLKDLGLLGTHLGVLLPEVARALPFAILVIWGFLAALPDAVLEAAEVDGASPAEQMLRVALPLARPALLAAGIWAFVSSWDEYLLPTLVSQDSSIQTVPTLLATFVGRYDTQYGLLAAASVLAVLPALLLLATLRRSAAAGLVTAVRGVKK